MKAGVKTTEAIGGAAIIAALFMEGRELPLPVLICVTALAAVYIVSRTWLKKAA